MAKHDQMMAEVRADALARLGDLSGADGDYSLRMMRCEEALRAVARLHDNDLGSLLEMIAEDFRRCRLRAEVDMMVAARAA